MLHACHLFSQARTQISYRPITPYSVDSLLFTSGRGGILISLLAVEWVIRSGVFRISEIEQQNWAVSS